MFLISKSSHPLPYFWLIRLHQVPQKKNNKKKQNLIEIHTFKKEAFKCHPRFGIVKVVGFWATQLFGLYFRNRPLCICESIFFFISHISVFLRLRTFHRSSHTLDSTLRAFAAPRKTFTYNSFLKDFENTKLWILIVFLKLLSPYLKQIPKNLCLIILGLAEHQFDLFSEQ